MLFLWLYVSIAQTPQRVTRSPVKPRLELLGQYIWLISQTMCTFICDDYGNTSSPRQNLHEGFLQKATS